MKKRKIYVSALALLCVGALFAQNEMDAFRFSHLDLNGSARSMSMGGAFGALGGDMSAMSHNPAGIGVYRSSEVQATLDLNMANMDATWMGINSDKNRTKFGFTNFSYVGYFPTGRDQGTKSWNIGISYNKAKDFNREYRITGSPQSSLADYVASRATNAFGEKGGITLNEFTNDPYFNNELVGNWLPVIGYRGGLIEPKSDAGNNDIYYSAFGKAPNETTLRVSEKGSISEYNFSLSTNISDRVFVGATFGVTDIDYRMSSSHDESFGGKDYLYLDNSIETEGTGYSFNIGVIARPWDILRVGVAYNSPKWYRMTDYYYAEAGSYLSADPDPEFDDYTPEGSYSEYKLRTPDRWIFSAAGIIGTSALISLDYELTNYRSMRLSDRDGNEYNTNTYIKEDFKPGHTVKIGAEYKVTPQFAVRAGYIWQPSPMEKNLTSSNRDELVEVLPSGTIPHYTVLNTTNHYTFGLGYRFTPNFYMDLACIYRVQNEKLYPYSNTFWNYPEDGISPVVSDPAKVSAKTTRLALTFGYKF
ncbi:MAG: outer membrane protein transport protein [Tannerella sp.]|jgi:hypothetical protein|nr:outer membrane protein transport protein [Tannerella sp.]